MGAWPIREGHVMTDKTQSRSVCWCFCIIVSNGLRTGLPGSSFTNAFMLTQRRMLWSCRQLGAIKCVFPYNETVLLHYIFEGDCIFVWIVFVCMCVCANPPLVPEDWWVCAAWHQDLHPGGRCPSPVWNHCSLVLIRHLNCVTNVLVREFVRNLTFLCVFF